MARKEVTEETTDHNELDNPPESTPPLVDSFLKHVEETFQVNLVQDLQTVEDLQTRLNETLARKAMIEQLAAKLAVGELNRAVAKINQTFPAALVIALYGDQLYMSTNADPWVLDQFIQFQQARLEEKRGPGSNPITDPTP